MRVSSKSSIRSTVQKTRQYEGTGIGLSIAKSIVEAHGGTIELQSALGKGSTFSVVLPNALFAGGLQPRDIQGLDEVRVILASEADFFRQSVSATLKACGLDVAEAKNRYVAARLAEETDPDLILFNDLPAGEAAAFISGLRENPATDSIPVIIFIDKGATSSPQARRIPCS